MLTMRRSRPFTTQHTAVASLVEEATYESNGMEVQYLPQSLDILLNERTTTTPRVKAC